ncbi:MAG: Hydroxyethylthiazole kinase [Firmicutes bacterium]|nr:Hydroxyethylthiazole kinase [Bacillota bacterium]
MTIVKEGSFALEELRLRKPLVHHITNYVTVNDCANIALAIGASPVMADDIGEVAEMVALASSLVLNMGTLNERTIKSMLVAGKKAKESGIPVVFDPVGVGATGLRNKAAEQVIDIVQPTVIRGNMSEIKLLAGLKTSIRGVDSVATEEDGAEVARELAKKLNCVVAITGKRDFIADKDTVYAVDNGHELLAGVTGTGCMATTLVGCFAASGRGALLGAVTGIMIMGLAGEVAAKSLQPTEGLGTFRMRLFDAIDRMTPEKLLQGGRVYAV